MPRFKAQETLGALAPDADLVFTLFGLFARFEYALKRSNFLRKARSDYAEPDWDRYADSVQNRFAEIHDPTFRDAVALLIEKPPRRQVIEGGDLSWADTARGDGEQIEKYVLRLVRVVRNNLFHGGKFPVPIGPVDDVSRNRLLLNAGIIVLNHCLVLSEQVRESFEETA